MTDTKQKDRETRARALVRYLKRAYAVPKTELNYETPMQLLVAVMLSAQSTDKLVNRVTDTLYKKYRTIDDFADADLESFAESISSVSFYRNKAKHIQATARVLLDEFAGNIPKTAEELIRLPGVAYKTAHVVLGELYGIWEGIPTDTHVRRFALRFDLTDTKELTKISKDLEALIPKEDWKYVNNGFVLYGRYVCNALPHECAEHPLTKLWPEAVHRWPKSK